nr:terpene synthase TPS4 [Freesia caryophyllacea]
MTTFSKMSASPPFPFVTTRNSGCANKTSTGTISQSHYSSQSVRLVQRLDSLLTNVREEQSDIKHAENLMRVKSLFPQLENPLECMKTIDSLQRLGIDYHFKEEIRDMLGPVYERFLQKQDHLTGDLFEVSLSFRLLRQAGHHVSSDVFYKFIDDKGKLDSSLRTDIEGLLSLHEASYLNTGEDILYIAKEFTIEHLTSLMEHLESDDATLVEQTLKSPIHKTLSRYNSPYYINGRQEKLTRYGVLNEVARVDFNQVQTIYQKELFEILSWWKEIGLVQELTFIRDQPLKWYTWSMTVLPDPQFSKCRISLTKVIAFVYIIDDIFDIYGTLEELSLFTEAIRKWELSGAETLPTYMQILYKTLYDITNEIAEATYEEHNWNPIDHLKESWARLCDAFLKEAKWFQSKKVPKADEYLANAIVSSGVYTVLLHAYFLLGEGITQENANFLKTNPTLLSSPATILRLWDDLGNAEDENQEGYDGSYVEYLMQENPNYTMESSRDHVMKMISSSWEALNKECFSSSQFAPNLVAGCLNLSRMIEVMYSYDTNQNLPVLEEYITKLLFKSI